MTAAIAADGGGREKTEQEEEDELQRFREQWRRELTKGNSADTSSAPDPAASATQRPTAAAAAATSSSDAYNSLDAYTRAVLAERRHDPNTALESYKRAFRLHDAPDKIYHRACALLLSSSSNPTAKGKAKLVPTHVDGLEVSSLLDPALVALLRTSLEPGTDVDRVSTSKAATSVPAAEPPALTAPTAAIAKPETPQTSPTTITQPLPTSPQQLRHSQPTSQDPHTLPPTAPLIPHGPSTSSSLPFIVPEPTKKSSNSLLPILTHILKTPRPDPDAAGKSNIHASHRRTDTAKSAASADGKRQSANGTEGHSNGTKTKPKSSPVSGGGLIFRPLDEEQPCPLTRLPDELLLLIVEEVARPKGRRGEKLPLPIGLHSVPGAPVLGAGGASSAAGGVSGTAKEGGIGTASMTAAKQAHAEPGGSSTAAPQHQPPHINHHPLGLAVNLALPDVPSLEALGRTCTKWRILTSGASALGAGGQRWGVWRNIVRQTFMPPILPSFNPILSTLNTTSTVSAAKTKQQQRQKQQQELILHLIQSLYQIHQSDWRTLYIEQPRIRLNGCYIASCRYTRPGMSEENVWISVVHVVEFYRVLRFLPDGTVMSLLSTDLPAESVRRMEPGWRRSTAGLCLGRWRLYPWGLPEEEERRESRRKRRRRQTLMMQNGLGGPDAGAAAGVGMGIGSANEEETDGENGLVQGMNAMMLQDAYSGAQGGDDPSGGGINLTAAEMDDFLVEGDQDDDDEDEADAFYEYDSEDELIPLQNGNAHRNADKHVPRTPQQPKLVLYDLRDRTLPKYSFRMVFNLKSSVRGRWNRLELETYESIHLGNGERLGLPMPHTKPFLFSVVRSYGVG
ncbi:hypothetical protein OC845_002071 [Tilletia horrida]|nr:hypothetical protein OC845_002071 [Tilletia horrida]